MEKYWYAATIERIVDGDTVTATIALGCDVYISQRLRLYGINAPETHGVSKASPEYKRGMKATNFLKDLIGGKEVLIHTHKDKTGKYGRYLAEIYLLDGDEVKQINNGVRIEGKDSVNDLMIEKGLAVPYYGGKRGG